MKSTLLDFEKPIAELEEQIEQLLKQSENSRVDFTGEIRRMQEKLEKLRSEIYQNLSAWQRVQIARHPARPFFLDYVRFFCNDFIELHGDRLFGDDPSMPCGLATIGEFRCAIIGQQKGRDTKENILRNFGCPHPEGYRKALRVMKLAEKFSLPVVCFIDTPGAYPGIGAEERHIAEAIAVNIREMMVLKTPIVAVVIGEGGSGGALGIGVADRVLMLENAYYSVISPEGCAAILWKHRRHAPEAAEALKLDARSLLDLGIIDEIVPEPPGGAHKNPQFAAEKLYSSLLNALRTLTPHPIADILQKRYNKFRRIGIFSWEQNSTSPSPSQ
ncbi:MAG: acetyl-CoA carboxylase carboxyltransferase subunit alpha [Chthoniobacterales bacterium]|nr:acetyl-CoA carboxylase carboxyltransferase subunit alpha [Chthoniobacterales bacterium]